MGVHRDGRLAEGHVQHHIGGLSPHSRQRLQRFAVLGHLAAMLFDQNFGQRDDVLGLAAKQPDGLDGVGQFFFAQRHHLMRRVHRLEQRRGRLVDALVGGLGRQRHRHQQGKGIDVMQFGLGFGIKLLQPREKLFGLRSAELLHRPRTSFIA